MFFENMKMQRYRNKMIINGKSLYHLPHKTLWKIIIPQKVLYISLDAKGEIKVRKNLKQHNDMKRALVD